MEKALAQMSIEDDAPRGNENQRNEAFQLWCQSLPRPNPYQRTLDMLTAFEGHVAAMDADPTFGWTAFTEWTKTEAVRCWVADVARVDPLSIPKRRKEYFMAPFWVAYHRSIEILGFTDQKDRKNAFMEM